MHNVAIFGATSAIAEAVARRLIKPEARFYLVGRDDERLALVAADLAARGAQVQTQVADLVEVDAEGLVAEVFAALGVVDLILIAYGLLPDQEACEKSLPTTLEAIAVNGTSQVALAMAAAAHLERQGGGTLAAITSVAADRGRRSNYVYGAAKALVATFLAGLRHRFHGRGVRVVDIRPGFVDTPMTARFENKGLLWSSPDRVAGNIVRALEKGSGVYYVPGYWRAIMAVIRALPEGIFHRLPL
ncbi:MAG: short-chain dehydrogenase [Porticoccaceae bacterium]|nr:MAG: short-chain dehydrogenase [Porticoccaceae bacterium]